MERNVGGYDRLARLVVGPVLLLVGIVSLAEILPLGLPVAAVALVVGAVFLVTGLVQQCPLNSLLGVNTCSR
jgi:uncharacterized membrane protein HdeD (DUF308 family)